MSALIEKLRRAREQAIQVGGYTFTVRRPTDLEMLTLRERLVERDIACLLPFVVGWSGVNEIDLVPGGDPVPAPFDAALCGEWLADRPDLLNPLTVAILDAYKAHAQELDDAKKN